jgi:hypothetical protein
MLLLLSALASMLAGALSVTTVAAGLDLGSIVNR